MAYVKKGGWGGKRTKKDGTPAHVFTPEQMAIGVEKSVEARQARAEQKRDQMEAIATNVEKQLRELMGVRSVVQVVDALTSPREMHRRLQNAVWTVLTSHPDTLDIWLRVMVLNRPGLFSKLVAQLIPSAGKMPDEPEELGPKEIFGDAAGDALEGWLARCTQGLNGKSYLPGPSQIGVHRKQGGEGEVIEGVCSGPDIVDQHVSVDARPAAGGDDPAVHHLPIPG